MSIIKSKKIASLVLALALVGAVGITAAAASEFDGIQFFAVEGATPVFENVAPGEAAFAKELDPAELGAGGVAKSAVATVTLVAVKGVTPNFEDAIPGELVVIEGVTPTALGEQGVTAAK